jgi:hypothetical protein
MRSEYQFLRVPTLPGILVLAVALLAGCGTAPQSTGEHVDFASAAAPLPSVEKTVAVPEVEPRAASGSATVGIASPPGRMSGDAGAGVVARRVRPVVRVMTMEAAAPPSAVPEPATPTGSAAFHIPKNMREKEASLVDLWIDRRTTVDELRAQLAAKLQVTADRIGARVVRDSGGQGGMSPVERIDGAAIPIGDVMLAQLRGGEDFAIEPDGLVRQSLAGEDRAKWNWRVTPKHAAASGMVLDLDIWIDPGPGQRLIDSYHERVIVAAIPVSPIDELYELLKRLDEWLVLLGVGGIGGVWAWLAKRKKAAG